MNATQTSRLAVAFARETARSKSARLCTACVEMLGVAGAGITIMDGDQAGPICVSDGNVAALEAVQHTSGLGPSRDTFASGRSVHTPRLDIDAASRWPQFVTLARRSGFRAVFAYPLITSGCTIGALTLYQHVEGDLTSLQHDDSIALADVLTEAVLSLQDDAPTGGLTRGFDDSVPYRAEIHQASPSGSCAMRERR